MRSGFYHEVHLKFADSPEGELLEQNIRFGDFKPDYVPNDTWEELLGDDVNNLRHMPYTYEIARQFTVHERLGSEALKLAAISHDWGEAAVGDVALPEKLAQGQDQLEVEAWWQTANKIRSQFNYSVDFETAAQIVWGEHELSEAFKVVEYIGYCRTGIKAGKVAPLIAGGIIELPELTRGQSDGLVGGLLALNKMVELKNYPVLAKYAKKYPSIPRLL